MKTILAIIATLAFVGLVLLGCKLHNPDNQENSTGRVTTTLSYQLPYQMQEYDIKGHTYLVLSGYEERCIIHAQHCKCLERLAHP